MVTVYWHTQQIRALNLILIKNLGNWVVLVLLNKSTTIATWINQISTWLGQYCIMWFYKDDIEWSRLGEIIEKEPRTISKLGAHLEGLWELIFSVIGLLFWLAITYLLPNIFADNWRWQGLSIVVVAIIADIIRGVLKFVLGKVQSTHLVEATRNMVSGVANYLLYQIYPFKVTSYLEQRNFDINIDDIDVYIRYLLLFLSIVFFISTVSEIYKYLTWVDRDKRSMIGE